MNVEIMAGARLKIIKRVGEIASLMTEREVAEDAGIDLAEVRRCVADGRLDAFGVIEDPEPKLIFFAADG